MIECVMLNVRGHMNSSKITRQDVRKVRTLPYFNKVDIRTAKTIPDLKIIKEADKKSEFDGTYRIVNIE